jgi:ribosomal protein S18 acetylase RimI-like enzyme
MEAIIRVAAIADLPDVLRLWLDADAAPTHTDDVDSLTRLIAHDPAALLLAETEGHVIGSVIAAWDGWRGSIYRLVVAPSHRRRGLGCRLLREAEKRLATAGTVRSQAIVVDTDSHARGFWQMSGWEQQADRLRFVRG